MAKRRNPKKEKAQRNEAYARKFRKNKTGNFSRNRRYNRPPKDNSDSEKKEDSSEEQVDSNRQNSDSR
ncbi:MAG: hypothetical protein RIE73_21855 [Coleofasciculus sp. C1-SOL-03]|jgi:hypothetical protein|uniref:hypothetical protein n=1 Tax=Coleofasciculus sp. C1-SOL-03 TaxID=3069522 RepID=UPI0032F57BF4